jgi:hypothetical protein
VDILVKALYFSIFIITTNNITSVNVHGDIEISAGCIKILAGYSEVLAGSIGFREIHSGCIEMPAGYIHRDT